MPDRARLEVAADLAAIQLEADVDADRPDRRTIAQPEPERAAQLAQVQVGGPVEDVAAVGKERRAELAPDRHAQLAVEDQHRVAAERKPVRR